MSINPNIKASTTRTRIRTVAIFAPIPLLMIVVSQYSAWLIFLVIAFMAIYEWRKIIFPYDFYTRHTRIALGLCVLAMIALLFDIIPALLIASFSALYAGEEKRGRLGKLLFLSQAIPLLMGIFAYSLRAGENGLALLGLAIVITSVSDSAAYFIGRAFGKRKMAPKLSPGKSWEGAIGAWVVTIMICLIYVRYLVPEIHEWSIFAKIPLFFLLTLAGQLGDLAESAFKRAYNIKDSGEIFPGHGGVLDRFDSLAPVLLLLGVVHWLLL